jgi:hypothetical protein
MPIQGYLNIPHPPWGDDTTYTEKLKVLVVSSESLPHLIKELIFLTEK